MSYEDVCFFGNFVCFKVFAGPAGGENELRLGFGVWEVWGNVFAWVELCVRAWQYMTSYEDVWFFDN